MLTLCVCVCVRAWDLSSGVYKCIYLWYFFCAGRQSIAILDVDGTSTFKKEMKSVGDDWTLASSTADADVSFCMLPF